MFLSAHSNNPTHHAMNTPEPNDEADRLMWRRVRRRPHSDAADDALRDAVNRIDDPLHFMEVVDQFFRENRQIYEGVKASSMSCEC